MVWGVTCLDCLGQQEYPPESQNSKKKGSLAKLHYCRRSGSISSRAVDYLLANNFLKTNEFLCGFTASLYAFYVRFNA